MPKITDIKPQTRNKSRVSVFIDGEFACGLDKLTALAYRLHIGDEADAEKLAAATRESESASAFERAAKYLGARPRTEKEIKTYLREKGYAPEAAEAATEKLRAYGYLDDAAYARQYIGEYRHKAGVRKLEADLRARGVPRDVIEAALAETGDQTEEVVRLAQKYLRSHVPDGRKLAAYLANRGFEYDTIKSALAELKETSFDEEGE